MGQYMLRLHPSQRPIKGFDFNPNSISGPDRIANQALMKSFPNTVACAFSIIYVFPLTNQTIKLGIFHPIMAPTPPFGPIGTSCVSFIDLYSSCFVSPAPCEVAERSIWIEEQSGRIPYKTSTTPPLEYDATSPTA